MEKKLRIRQKNRLNVIIFFIFVMFQANLLISCALVGEPEAVVPPALTPTALPERGVSGEEATPASPSATSVAPIASQTALVPATPSATIGSPETPTPLADPLLERVEQLLGQMSVEQKVGQLFLVYFVGPELSAELKQMINEYHVGGILFFGVSDNIRSLPQVAELINGAQNEAVTHGTAIPLFVGIDHEGGSVVRLRQGATIFPSNMAIGATGAVENVRQAAQISAQELKALGINMNLAPVVDVNNNPANPVIGIRSFGSSPEQVAQFGQAMIETYQTNGIIATAKHFPGHGDTSVDSHVGLPLVPHDLNHLQNIELRPFEAAIDANVAAIMTAHVLFPAFEPTSGLPATLSSNVLRGLLREKMRFQGLIVTDSLGMGALDQQYGVTKAGVMAFQAGADILAFGADTGHTPAEQRLVRDELLALVQSGDVSQERLDDSVRRILLAKARAGLLDRQSVNLADIPQQVGTSEHRQIAHQIAQQSITLVKDEQNTLPISPEQSVYLIWPTDRGNLADAMRPYHSNLLLLPISLNPSPEEIQLAQNEAAHAEIVLIATVDVHRYPAQADLVNALLQYNPIVTALGTPYDLMHFPNVPTYLTTYGNVPHSLDALAQVLIGQHTPQGQLPVELPGLYRLGHGLK